MTFRGAFSGHLDDFESYNSSGGAGEESTVDVKGHDLEGEEVVKDESDFELLYDYISI
jgi:hypothetical protein